MSGIRWQTFPEALRNRPIESKYRTKADEHTLAVGCDHIFAFGEHPVEAVAAYDRVLGRRIVQDVDDVVAIPTRDLVFGSFAEHAIDQVVITFLAHYLVGAAAAGN